VIVKQTKATAALVTTVVLWASAFVAIRHLANAFSAGSLALGRLLIGSAVLTVLVLVTRSAMPKRKHWPRLIACGVLWFALYNVALNEAERTVDAGTAAMLVNIAPILVAILAGYFLKEGFPRSVFLGSVIGFAGVVLIGLSTSNGGGSSLWGVFLCVVAAIAYAVSVVLQKPLLADLPGLTITWIACSIGAVACLPFTPALVRELGTATPDAIGSMVYLAVAPTAIGFLTWAYALSRTSAGLTANATFAVPPVSVLLAWLLLSETPPVLAFIGGAVCLAGVYVARRKS
jgi:drug/metabolite transporter (DMT)-like permease